MPPWANTQGGVYTHHAPSQKGPEQIRSPPTTHNDDRNTIKQVYATVDPAICSRAEHLVKRVGVAFAIEYTANQLGKGFGLEPASVLPDTRCRQRRPPIVDRRHDQGSHYRSVKTCFERSWPGHRWLVLWTEQDVLMQQADSEIPCWLCRH